MSSPLARALAGACLTAALIACVGSTPPPATGMPPAGDAAEVTVEDQIPITVVNNRVDGGTVTVYVEPLAGARTQIGAVESGATRALAYRVQGGARRIRLIALNANGAQMTSETVTVPRNARVTWDLQINSIRIR